MFGRAPNDNSLSVRRTSFVGHADLAAAGEIIAGEAVACLPHVFRSAGSDNVTGDSSAFLSLYFLGFVLFVMTLALNLTGDVFVRRTRQKY